MNKIYTIVIDDGDVYEKNIYTHDKCFSIYVLAKEYLLDHFDCQTNSLGEYFILKENVNYISEFCDGAIATIEELTLEK